MANYSLPESFFPPYDEVTYASQQGTWSHEELLLRQAALHGYLQSDAPDRELSKWMIPLYPWEAVPSFPTRGSLDVEWFALLSSLYSEPRSLLHFVGATFTHLQVLSLTEDSEIELETLSTGRELLLIRIARGKKVLIRHTHAPQGKGAFCIIGQIAPDAQVTYKADYTGLQDSFFGSHERWYLEKGAQLDIQAIVTGIRQSWMRKEFMLAERAEVSASWLAVLKDKEEAALTTVQNHTGSSSRSSVMVKSVLSQEARSFYRGTIVIENQARLSQANQQQRALLISPQARTCSIPSLEVAAHEVSCQHGSAAGKFDPQEILYLRQRGLDEQQAQKLIIEGFLQGSSLEQSTLERLKKQICLDAPF